MTGPLGLRVRIALLVIVTAAALDPESARANDFDQFQNARVAYESTNYDLAADLFKGLLDEATTEDTRPLVLESRKYLAATYLFLGRKGDAEAQLALLLRAEPEYVLDPLAFPAEFVKMFAGVEQRLEQERERNEQERARAAAQEQVKDELTDQRRRQQIRRLVEIAGTERVLKENSRWVAMLPFGIGQFQNGHDDLGLTLAISQGLLLGTGIVGFVINESLSVQEPDDADRPAAEDADLASRLVNQISLGLFTAVAITGVIDAQIRFRPSTSYLRPRRLPPDLRELQLVIGPTGASLTGTF